jgi:hypothetical protein
MINTDDSIFRKHLFTKAGWLSRTITEEIQAQKLMLSGIA